MIYQVQSVNSCHNCVTVISDFGVTVASHRYRPLVTANELMEKRPAGD